MKKLIPITLLMSFICMTTFTSCNDKNVNSETSTNALEVIMNRTSIRYFKNTPVEDAKVDQMLRAAMAAPTAGNRQPWSFVVVTNKALLTQLGEVLPHAKMTSKAPLAIVACGNLSKALDGEARDYWVQDVAASIENLLLAAHALDLGAVWTGVYPMMDRVDDVRSILSLPQEIVPVAVIPVGYPVSKASPKAKWEPENIYYNGWNRSK